MSHVGFLLFAPEDFNLAKAAHTHLCGFDVRSSIYVVPQPHRLRDAALMMRENGVQVLIVVARAATYPPDTGPFLSDILSPCIVIVSAQTDVRTLSIRALTATLVSKCTTPCDSDGTHPFGL